MTGPRRTDRLFGMHAVRLLFLVSILSGFGPATVLADPFDDLARDVWAWRAATQPSSGDDIPRIDRPANWLPDWSPAAVAARRTALADFARRHQAIATSSWPVARQVDHRLIGSLLARVRWELDGAPAWRRDPAFFIQQALGPVFDVLLPQMAIFPDAAAQVRTSAAQARDIRTFLDREGLLTVPPWLGHYLNLLLPPYIAPIAFLGVTDDLTGPSRLSDNGYSYIRAPRPDLPYFYLSTARDPRPIIVHEGVPGHYMQLALSWAHENPIRRHYDDSGANEGLGFYAEEMMLQAGLWHDSPRSREIIYNFARLRALRVEVDVKLATGLFTIPQAAEYLEKTVPMDAATALEEAASFAAGPGQAITYQSGKLQVTSLLADARRAQGAAFSLRAFHDYLWKNGNVPLALLRWELLGDRRDVDRLATLK